METLESNYKVARRVYQQLYYDIAELFYEYIQSIDLYEREDIEEDLKLMVGQLLKILEQSKTL